MATIGEIYTKEIYREFGYFVTWLPSLQIKLGDVGVLKGNQFTKITTLKEQKIPFKIDEHHSEIDLNYSSKGGVSISTKLEGVLPISTSVLKQEDTGVILNFSKENAILFKVNSAVEKTISNRLKIGEEVIRHYKENSWEKNWVVITELVQAESASILISKSAKGKIELKTRLESTPSDIFKLDSEMQLVFHQDIALKILANKGLTPLFKTMKLKGGFPFKARFTAKAMNFEKNKFLSTENLSFESCSFDDSL